MPQRFNVDELVDWISMEEAAAYLETLTHHRYSRATLYGWARKGRLGTTGYRPLKTTRKMVRSFADKYLAFRTTSR